MTYNYLGSVQSFTVPMWVTSITVDAYGAVGGVCVGVGTACGLGGRGGRLQALISVTPGEQLDIRIGGAGSATAASPFNGGGGCAVTSSNFLASGGGATDIRPIGSTIDLAYVIAGIYCYAYIFIFLLIEVHDGLTLVFSSARWGRWLCTHSGWRQRRRSRRS